MHNRHRGDIVTGRFRTAGALVAPAIVAAAAPGCSYNQFVAQEEAIRTQWAQVENQPEAERVRRVDFSRPSS